MTWRVAILAFAIMLSGATAPAIRDAFGGRPGYRVMGVAIAVLLVVGVVGAYVGTRPAPIGRVAPGPGRCASSCASSPAARDFRLLLTTFVMQALATGAMLAGVAYVSRWVLGRQGRGDDPVRLLRRPGAAADPGVERARPADRQEAGLRRLLARARRRRRAAGAGARSARRRWVYVATALVGLGYAGCQVFPMAMLPDAAAVDARRTGENRAGVYTGVWTAGETLGLALGPADLRAGAGGGRLPAPPPTSTTSASPRSAMTAIVLGFSLLPAVLIAAQPVLPEPLLARRTWSRRPRRRGAPHERRARPAARDAGRRRAGHRRPHAGLRLRLRPRGGRPGRAARRWRRTPAPTGSTRRRSPAC